jgi:DNA invertase Pin-like site-specific DNA recombinase
MNTSCCIYGRISTIIHNQDINNQLVPLRNLARLKNLNIYNEYIDEGISGSKGSRPALDKLLKDAKKGHFKIVLIYSIDRLGRSTSHLINLLNELKQYGVVPVFIRENIDLSENNPVGNLIFHILASISEFEKALISERIKTSLAVRKALANQSGSNWTCGRPGIDNKTKELVLHLRKQGLSYRNISKELGISKSSVERIIKEDVPKP